MRYVLEHEVILEVRTGAINLLCKIHSAEADRALVAMVSPVSGDGEVVVKAINEAAKRELREVIPSLPALAVHYRGDVRTAARDFAVSGAGRLCADVLGVASVGASVAFVKVNELVLELANEAAGDIRFVDLGELYRRAPAERAGYVRELQAKAAQLPARWMRSLRVPYDYCYSYVVEFWTAGILVSLGIVWGICRRRERRVALSIVGILWGAAVVTCWYPLLQEQRTMLWMDRVPVAAVAVAGLVLVGKRVGRERAIRAMVAAVMVALVCAWAVGRVLHTTEWERDALSMGIVVLLGWVAVQARGWWSRVVAWMAVVIVGSAIGAPAAETGYYAHLGYLLPPFSYGMTHSHFMVAVGLGVGCVVGLMVVRQERASENSERKA